MSENKKCRIKFKCNNLKETLSIWNGGFREYTLDQFGYLHSTKILKDNNNIIKAKITINYFESLVKDYPIIDNLLTPLGINLKNMPLITDIIYNKILNNRETPCKYKSYLNEDNGYVNIIGKSYVSESTGEEITIVYKWKTVIDLGWVDISGIASSMLTGYINTKIENEFNKLPELYEKYKEIHKNI